MSRLGEGLLQDADELGECIRITVDLSIYSKVAVFKAAYWFTDRCYLFLSYPNVNDQALQVEVRSKTTTNLTELEAISREFGNSLIDHEVRQQVLSETGEVREHLLRKAFFEGAVAADVPQTLVSNESHNPPQQGESDDDPLGITQRTGERDEDRQGR